MRLPEDININMKLFEVIPAPQRASVIASCPIGYGGDNRGLEFILQKKGIFM